MRIAGLLLSQKKDTRERPAMHFTEPVYRNPYWPTWPLLEVTQGCTHNRCKFCTMYKGVPFRMTPLEQVEEDLAGLKATVPGARTLQLLSANPLVLPYDRLATILEMVRKYLPRMEHVYAAGRVTDLRNKTAESWKNVDGCDSAEVDAAIALDHMMMEAWECGVGSTWMRGFDERVMRRVFGIPNSWKVAAMMPMGYPAENARPSGWHFRRKSTDELCRFV